MKRRTKEQREAELKAALLRRVTDVYAGAGGRLWETDDFAIAADLSRIVPALKDLLGPQLEAHYLWAPHCLEYFNDPQSAANFLFDAGFRA